MSQFVKGGGNQHTLGMRGGIATVRAREGGSGSVRRRV
jgi:hypothetical protein